jgi:ankyrin repeat protein
LCGGSLAQAAKDGDIDLMTRLLEEGAEVDALDENKRTPLILACMSNHNHVGDPVISCSS